MSKIRRKLARLIKLENTHDGHEVLMAAANRCRVELDKLIRNELENACENGRQSK